MTRQPSEDFLMHVLRNNQGMPAPWAVDDRQATRRFQEPEHPYRSPFQRDRDRIVHSSAFRRLDFKTQVFVPHEHDHFRTRLTHTLEVSQIARTLGRTLGLNEDLIEAVALAHDLGHSPFGHAGEGVLNELMAGHGGFEHNRQSLRVVDYLEHPYPDFRGLNLTQQVRECLAKHRSRYDTPDCGEFDASVMPPLEGQIVDLADEIAYTSADLDDAFGAGWVELEDLKNLQLWQGCWESARSRWPGASAAHIQIRATKDILSRLADDVVVATRDELIRSKVQSLDDVRRAGRPLAIFSPQMISPFRQLQDFLTQRVYLHPANREHCRQIQQIMRELFAAYVRSPNLLPDRYALRISSDGLARVVCDYIAGMTDRFCHQQHEAVTGRRD